MGKIILDITEGKVVKLYTVGMKPKPISRYEKIRRTLTRNRPNPFKGFNEPIDWNKHNR
jgi:hypothetical protein